MLKHLSIKNYALIDHIEIDLPASLTIITGETGAGKSILLGALSLITGSRADTTALQDKSRKCIVEGLFDIRSYSLKEFFERHELDYSDQTVIRRELSPEGKSRSFINDTPVSLAILKELSYFLIDIHSQHETLTLNEMAYQLDVVDAFADTIEMVERYRKEYKQLKAEENLLAELTEKDRKARQDADYWQFQYDELELLGLKDGEQDLLESELKVLENAEGIRMAFGQIGQILNGAEHAMDQRGALSALKEIQQIFSSLSTMGGRYQEMAKRLSGVYVELKDISLELDTISEQVVADPARTEQVRNRLDEIYRLQKKHQVNSLDDLLEIKNKIGGRLLEKTSIENRIGAVRKEVERLKNRLFSQAKKISEIRLKALPGLEKEIVKWLSTLSLPHARFHSDHTLLESLTEHGIDKISFLFSANKGGALQSVSKTASGGELSRLMLVIKYLVAKHRSLPTIIFDEIDSGVSGGVAEQVGRLILGMSEKMQVLTITHLPQIASKGGDHFSVFKKVQEGKTYSGIKKLTLEERVNEIAGMLSSGKPSDVAIRNAKELLKA